MSDKIDPVLEAIKNIDLSKVTAEEVLKDVIEQSGQFALRMAIASTILETIRGAKPTPVVEENFEVVVS
jgi:hypothetical protein